VAADALAALMSHPWPGNVRELRNVLERGAVVTQGHVIQLADLGLGPAQAIAPAQAGAAAKAGEGVDPPSLEAVEKRHITEVLQYTGGNVTRSARILGIDRVTLYNKIRRYQLR
jgi:DNA-binding NtrC family response regulator